MLIMENRLNMSRDEAKKAFDDKPGYLQELCKERFWGTKNIINWRTRKIFPKYHDDAMGREILHGCQLLEIIEGHPFMLWKDEAKLLYGRDFKKLSSKK
jgi:hypothetical protein